jgi:hypothetical protein
MAAMARATSGAVVQRRDRPWRVMRFFGGQATGAVTGRLPGWCRSGYFTKYQYSGVRLSVGLCGVTPLRLLAISVIW